eukprot:GHRQ01028522.1.p1 GENE.GHRQ01028522.1~~GHRQ01028522.1.p1  ORF type:complete len:128 (+),score=60.64 GHRQ01028522.1:335-718(+)
MAQAADNPATVNSCNDAHLHNMRAAVAVPFASACVYCLPARLYALLAHTATAEVKELEEKGELDDADPLGGFFKKIFSQGDEDTRRAMMKSFVESNGTVLSTNWKDIGAKKTECTPPEGMELHKWQE